MHLLFSHYSALNAMALLTLLFALMLLVFRPTAWASKLCSTINFQLPAIGSELVLFLSAGTFSVGCSMLMSTLPQWSPFSEFGFAEATYSFLGIVLLGQLGIHPVASIAFMGPIILKVAEKPMLVANVFLYAWAPSSAVSPLSSQNLSTFSRYHVDAKKLYIRNIRYAILLAILIIINFFFYSRFAT
jgi:hypothetical protein